MHLDALNIVKNGGHFSFPLLKTNWLPRSSAATTVNALRDICLTVCFYGSECTGAKSWDVFKCADHMRMMKSRMLWIALQFVCSKTSRTQSFYHQIIHKRDRLYWKWTLYFCLEHCETLTPNWGDPENKYECWLQQIVVYLVEDDWFLISQGPNRNISMCHLYVRGRCLGKNRKPDCLPPGVPAGQQHAKNDEYGVKAQEHFIEGPFPMHTGVNNRRHLFARSWRDAFLRWHPTESVVKRCSATFSERLWPNVWWSLIADESNNKHLKSRRS